MFFHLFNLLKTFKGILSNVRNMIWLKISKENRSNMNPSTKWGLFVEKLFMKSMSIHISFVVMFAMDKVCDC